ncbi:MAG: c-type cytochrome [Thiothrix sp.]|nr:c-type cytochrome [Thiothrix sp.]
MRTMIALASMVLFGCVGLAQADDVEEGAKLYTEKLCLTCHGEHGNKPIMPIYPKLGGQNADYAVAQMKDIKTGARNNGLSATMKAIVAATTDEELTKIAKYLEVQVEAPAADTAAAAATDAAATDATATDAAATATQ